MSHASGKTPASELALLRARIDELNRRILALAQERAEVVLEIARSKDALGLEAYDPEREERMLQKLIRSTSGPFDPGEVREIFQALFRASLSLQERKGGRRRAVHPLSAGGEAP